ncbi:MAG: hypothetical protein N2D54_04320, partial [Chloroflexota bacterium]
HLILRVISELWIEYLTKMEALRVSIGLEAYAQRDPLVEYKTKASKMFQDLFNDMRMSVVSRMFTLRPQIASQAQPAPEKAVVPKLNAPEKSSGGGTTNGQQGSEKKKRRRRRKKKK